MSVIDAVRSLLESTDPTARQNEGTGETKGAYWCTDCDERVPGTEVEGDDAPACPSCGDEMTFERSPGSAGCAC
jgi:DNA-directed RNA polymerase subunit RPC12/RpoP